jgi:hypothetical protein
MSDTLKSDMRVSVRKEVDWLESFVILFWLPIRFQEVACVDARESWSL